jgi:hypothetical protein
MNTIRNSQGLIILNRQGLSVFRPLAIVLGFLCLSVFKTGSGLGLY